MKKWRPGSLRSFFTHNTQSSNSAFITKVAAANFDHPSFGAARLAFQALGKKIVT